jgi:hypothetical protein
MVADLLKRKEPHARLIQGIVQPMGGYQQFGHLVGVWHGRMIGTRPPIC